MPSNYVQIKPEGYVMDRGSDFDIRANKAIYELDLNRKDLLSVFDD